MSYLATIITNLAISIHGKAGSKPKEIKDFLIDWDVSKPKEIGTQSIEDIKRIFGGIAEANKRKESKKRDSKRLPKSLQNKQK
ncbi:MAG: hypothetical protein M0R03_22670 [Novosphingobium sp.]|nr:hypothetical protein [Novosphingobium sp.]